MQVTTALLGEELQLKVTGDVNNETSPELRQVMDTLWSQAVRTVALDLSNVTYLSSSGISLLLETRLRAMRQQGRLSISQVSAEVREVLATCRLDGLLLS